MKKMIVLMVIVAVLALPLLAQAGGTRTQGRVIVQGPFYWHPFFYPGPFTYGYPGPYVSSGPEEPYTYGYPGPYSYGTWDYSRPKCLAKPNGYWVCS